MTDDTRPALKPANENPWYLLATLYGEQEEGIHSWEENQALASKNRIAWNRWMASALTPTQRSEIKGAGISRAELCPFNEAEVDDILENFVKRACCCDTLLPDPYDLPKFSGCHFKGGFSLKGFMFPKGADFSRSLFSSYVTFTYAEFLSTLLFESATFADDVNFHHANFHGGGFFVNTEFSCLADFSSAKFFSNIHFRGADFESKTLFYDAKFLHSPPDFRDAKLCEATEWDDADWPPSPEIRGEAQQQIYVYERLKAEMERLKKHEDEQFFFAKELRARRALLWFRMRDKERRFGERVNDGVAGLMNEAYDLFGSYGLSVVRPIFWLFSLFSIGFAILATTNSLDDGPMDPWDAAGLSATNLISLLPYKPDKFIIDHLSPAAKIIGNLQSIFGLILLFLLGLALRNRFRMK